MPGMPTMGYPSGPQGYPQSGYPQTSPGYPQANSGYPHQPAYPSQGLPPSNIPSGYPTQSYPSGGQQYPPGGQGYPSGGETYPSGGQGYPQASPGYTQHNQYQGYTAHNPSSVQRQASAYSVSSPVSHIPMVSFYHYVTNNFSCAKLHTEYDSLRANLMNL